mgnify:CR=1 FL=1
MEIAWLIQTTGHVLKQEIILSYLLMKYLVDLQNTFLILKRDRVHADMLYTCTE